MSIGKTGLAWERRCAGCHRDNLSLPRTLSDENGLSFWRPNWSDPRLKRSRHVVFNLTRPDLSLILLAPLSQDAGGLDLCRDASMKTAGEPVFASKEDPDYIKILALCVRGRERLEKIRRFDMAGFRPPEPYVREMKRYGVLPANLPADAVIDPYATDRMYWQSFEQRYALNHPAYAR